MYKISDFNICSSKADYDLYFNRDFRAAAEMAINYMMDEYEHSNDNYRKVKTAGLTLFIYPDTEDYRIEIKDRKNNPNIHLKDSIREWMELLEEYREIEGCRELFKSMMEDTAGTGQIGKWKYVVS